MTDSDAFTQLLIGVQTVQLQIFNALIDAGQISRDQAVASLEAATVNMPEDLKAGLPGILIQQLITGVQDHHPRSPEELRSMFQVLDGSRPPSGDTTPGKEPSPDGDDGKD